MTTPRDRFPFVRAGALSGALVAVLLLAGCFGGPVTSTPTGERVDAALQPYYDQVLLWVDCGDGAECSTVRAPMDWANPAADTDIELAVTRHGATGEALGSLFVNPGGPGASGYDLIHDSVDFAVSAVLRESFDIVGWDPRGVGRSTPVTCYDDEQLDDFIYGIAEAPDGTPEWVAEITAEAVAFGQACLDGTGPVLEFVDTESTVRDLDLLRAIVGDDTLHYLGYSYGSDIGATYAELFPSKVGRMVLDGATDSSLSAFDESVTQAGGFELALGNYLAACPSLEECPFTGDVPADKAGIRALMIELDETPIEAPDGRMLDAGVLDTALAMSLYSEDYWPEANAMFSEVQQGVTETAFYLADYYNGRDVDGTYIDNSLEAFLAISCVDAPVITDPAVIADYEARLTAAAPTTTFTSGLGDVLCAEWPFAYRGEPITAVTGAGAAPILVVSTTGDPATPYEWGVALSQQLESATLITHNGEGHTAYNSGVTCVDSAVDAYFVAGTVPPVDPDC